MNACRALQVLTSLLLATVFSNASASPVKLLVQCSEVSGPLDITGTISCQQFDTSLGSLSEIVLSLEADYGQTTVNVANNGSVPVDEGGRFASAIDFVYPPGFSFLPTPYFQTIPIDLVFGALLPGMSTFFPVINPLNIFSGPVPLTSGFLPYEGVGFFSIPVATSTSIQVFASDGTPLFGSDILLDWSFAGTARAIAQVEYIYEPCTGNCGGSVPEPATLALLGIGLAGLGFARRRRLN